MIFCFTGTGNSLLVARELQLHLGGEIVILEGDLLNNPSGTVLEIPQGEPVVWVFPIYSWGLPPVVNNFIRRSKIKGAYEASHFMVCTCGDDVGYGDTRWRRAIGARGWSPRGAFSVIMPNTYVCMKGFDTDPIDVANAKLAAMPGRIEEIARKIRAGFAESDVVRGSWSWIKTWVIYPAFKSYGMSPKPFHTTDACISCGKCAVSCPTQNITMADGRPQWGNNCAFCLRCYHICPRHAVQYGHETDHKGQSLTL